MATRMGIPLLVFVIMGQVAMPVTTSLQPWPRTTVNPWVDLRGKMFTVSRNAEIILTPPSTPWPQPTAPWPQPTSPWPQTSRPWPQPTAPWPQTTSPWPQTSRPWPQTTRSWPHYTTTAWPRPTTVAPARGVTVCLRYVSENNFQPIFTLSPNSHSSLAFAANPMGDSQLSFGGGYYTLDFGSFRPFWPIRPGFWNSVCVTVDTEKGVAQVFRGGTMSIRKKLPTRYVWGNEPILQIYGFDGQLTDVEVWDFPISYKYIESYMTYDYYRPSHGSVISWRQIRYSLNGNALLENDYDRQESQRTKRHDKGFQLPQQGRKKMKRMRMWRERK